VEPHRGLRFNPQALVDPYARALSARWTPRRGPRPTTRAARRPPHRVHTEDDRPAFPAAWCWADTLTGARRQANISWRTPSSTKAHVKVLTKLNPEIPPERAGFLPGLGPAADPSPPPGAGRQPAVGAGFPFHRVRGRGVSSAEGPPNYWAYSTLGLLAPAQRLLLPGLARRAGGRAEVDLKRRQTWRSSSFLDVSSTTQPSRGTTGPHLAGGAWPTLTYYHLKPDDPATYTWTSPAIRDTSTSATRRRLKEVMDPPALGPELPGVRFL